MEKQYCECPYCTHTRTVVKKVKQLGPGRPRNVICRNGHEQLDENCIWRYTTSKSGEQTRARSGCRACRNQQRNLLRKSKNVSETKSVRIPD